MYKVSWNNYILKLDQQQIIEGVRSGKLDLGVLEISLSKKDREAWFKLI